MRLVTFLACASVFPAALNSLRADEVAVPFIAGDATELRIPAGSEAQFTVQATRHTSGAQPGVTLLQIDSDRLSVVILPERGMSILSVVERTSGKRIFGWDSPVRDPVHPSLIDLESRGGLGWLEGFNEWMVRCGLEYAGHPGTDRIVTNTGEVSEQQLTLHGKIGNIPASEVSFVTDTEKPGELRIRGVVHERIFFGPKLELRTDLVLRHGSAELVLEDSVTNRGGMPQEFQLIYHANFGRPILGEGAAVEAAVRTIAPMNENAANGISKWQTYSGPTPGFTEEVFLIEPAADDQGYSTAVLTDRSRSLGAAITWSVEELPFLTVWKNTVAEADGYVTGIEPATGFPFNRSVERKFGRVPVLQPGETRSFTVRFTPLVNGADVREALNRVTALQAGIEPEVKPVPDTTLPE